jgi:hypothetical protein
MGVNQFEMLETGAAAEFTPSLCRRVASCNAKRAKKIPGHKYLRRTASRIFNLALIKRELSASSSFRFVLG